MERLIVFYFTWQEDQWLDELLDHFPAVIAMLPTAQSLRLAKEQLREEEAKKALLIVHPAGETEQTRDFLDRLACDETFAEHPLYIVGVAEAEQAAWQAACPAAEVVAVGEADVAFDYTEVLARMAAAGEQTA